MLIILCLFLILVQSANCLNKAKHCKCQGKVQSYIIGGQLSEANQYPWQVSLGFLPEKLNSSKLNVNFFQNSNITNDVKLSTHFCGGVILNEYFILTAAHCVVKFSNNLFDTTFKIGAGNFFNHSLIDIYDLGRVPIQKILIHPLYNHQDDLSLDDLALVKLEKPINFNQNFMQPACFHKKNHLITYDKIIGIGWGSTNRLKFDFVFNVWTGYKASEHLKEAYFKDISQISSLCRNTKKLICLESIDKNESVCQGDSGGSIVHIEKGKQYVIGITSFGNVTRIRDDELVTCYGQNVFIRIQNYLNWIKLYTGNDFCLI